MYEKIIEFHLVRPKCYERNLGPKPATNFQAHFKVHCHRGNELPEQYLTKWNPLS